MASANDRDPPVLELSTCDLLALHQACGGRSIYVTGVHVTGALGTGAMCDPQERRRQHPAQRDKRQRSAR
jgi:hypothetical protein